MALIATDRGTGSNNASATSMTFAPASNMTQGALGVLCIALDNAGAAGATAAAPTSFTDAKSNIWTLRQSAIHDPGAASAGVELAIYTAKLTSALLTTDTSTINWASAVSVTAKAWTLREVSTNAGSSKTVGYVTGAVNAGATTGTPTVTTGSITSGDCVIGAGAAESADTWAGDADTSSGSWSTQQHAGIGSGNTGMSVTSQAKVVTATATQTYNPTLTSADCILAWVQLRELNVYVLTADQASFTLAAQNISLLRGRSLTTAQAAYTLSAQNVTLRRSFAFSFRRTLTIDATQVGAADLTDFPVLVRFTDASFKTVANGGHVQNANGFDIVFFTSDDLTTQLAHEIEKYDATTGEIVMWVKLATISHTVNTSFVIAYGAAITTSQEQIAAVWSNGFVGVWHFSDGATLEAVNSVSTAAGSISGAAAASGQVDGAVAIGAASTDKITLDLTAAATLRTYTIWARRTGVGGGSAGRMFNKGTTGTTEYLSYVDATSSYDYSQFWTTGASWRAPAPSVNVWHFVVVRYDSSSSANSPQIDIDGVSQTVTANSSPSGTKTTNAEAYVIGNRAVDNLRNWAGELDEFRIADTIRTDGWALAEHLNQQSGSTFVTLGSEIGTRTLMAAVASYALAAQNVALLRGRVLNGAAAIYTLNAQNASLVRGRTLTAAAANYTLAAQAAILRRALRLPAQQASFVFAAQSVNLLRNRVLSITSASFALSAQNVNLLRQRTLSAAVASYTLNTQTVNLRRTRIMPVSVASYTLSAQNVTLNKGRTLNATAASFTLAANAIGFARTYRLAANLQAYTLSAQNVALSRGRSLIASTSVYALTVNASALLRGRNLTANSASYILTQTNAALLRARRLNAQAATFTLTAALNVLMQRKLFVDAALYVLTLFATTEGSLAASGMTFFAGSTTCSDALFSSSTTLATVFSGSSALQLSVFASSTTLE